MEEVVNEEIAPADAPRAEPSALSAPTVARYVGYLLVLMFAAYNVPPRGIHVWPPFEAVSQADARLWLSSAFLLFPACCLLGYGSASWLASPLERFASAVAAAVARRPRASAFALFAVGLLVARAGHWIVVRDFPITDDEYAIMFGGQVLASGHVLVPTIQPYSAVPHLFFYARDGLITSMDWIGGQAAWAIGFATGLGGALVHAAAASLAMVAVALAVGRRLGAGWGALGALYFAASPMAASLSFTTHAHLLSRAFVAVALFLYIAARERGGVRLWAACGFVIAVAFCCRPFEVSFLTLPFALELLWSARRDRALVRAIVAVAAGAVLPIAVFAAHSWAVTGNPFVPARLLFVPESNPIPIGTTYERFRGNMTVNLLLLAIWFLGPLGCILVAAGAFVDRLSRLLVLSVASVLALALFHDNTGIHVVGPIHYSECAVPLAVLAVYGTRALRDRLGERGVGFSIPACAIGFATVLGCGAFTAVNAIGLSLSAEIQQDVYNSVERAADPGDGRAVVLAPHFGQIWTNLPQYQEVGTWVFEWRAPLPDFSDRVLILIDGPGVEQAMRARFPDRKFYRLFPGPGADGVRMVELPGASEPAPAR